MSTHTGITHIDFPHFRLRVRYSYQPGRPEVRTLPNGDPGYPADPPELEVTECLLYLRDIAGGWLSTAVDLQAIDLLDEFGYLGKVHEDIHTSLEGEDRAD